MRIAITASPDAPPSAPIILRGQPDEVFAFASRLGYNGIEWHLRRPGDIDRDQVKRLMSRYDLGAPTIGTGLAAGLDGLSFAADEPQVRKQAVARIVEHIELAAHLESAVTIGLIWGRVGTDRGLAGRRSDNARACMAECCRAAQERGVTLLLEPLNRYESDHPNTVEQALDIVHDLGYDSVRLLLDTYHMNIEERSFDASLRQAGALLGHVHISDNNRRAPGHGGLNVRGVIHTLRDIGYGGYLSFEHMPLPTPEQAAEDAISTVQTFLRQES